MVSNPLVAVLVESKHVLTGRHCHVNRYISSLLTEKGPVDLHGLVPVMGAAGAPAHSSPCFHVNGRMDLLRGHLLFFHHPHNGWFWRLCGR